MPSTPDDPGRAVADGLGELAPDGRAALLAHGTTVATNALLEGRGAPVALVTTRGFADVIEIARQDRPSLYDQWADRPPRGVIHAAGDEPLDPALAKIHSVRLQLASRLGFEIFKNPTNSIHREGSVHRI